MGKILPVGAQMTLSMRLGGIGSLKVRSCYMMVKPHLLTHLVAMEQDNSLVTVCFSYTLNCLCAIQMLKPHVCRHSPLSKAKDLFAHRHALETASLRRFAICAVAQLASQSRIAFQDLVQYNRAESYVCMKSNA